MYTHMLTDIQHRGMPDCSISDTHCPNVQYTQLTLPKDLNVLH